MGERSNKCKLVAMFTLNFGFFFVELIVGYMGNSTALVADSFHMLSDVGALIVAFIALRMSPKKWSKNTYGWARAEVLGALVNAVFLVALCFTIVVESIQKLIMPEEISKPFLVLIVGSVGLLMNIVGLLIFCDGGGHGHSHGQPKPHGNTVSPSTSQPSNNQQENDATSRESESCEGRGGSALNQSNRFTRMVSSLDGGNDGNPENGSPPPPPAAEKKGGHMNIRGVILHVFADAMGSVIVVVAALVAYFVEGWEGNKYIDPVMSICMVFLILISACPLLKESSLILLQSIPDDINLDKLEQKLLEQVDGVMEVHELHVWQLAGDRIIATAHIKCRNLQEYFEIAEKVKGIFHDEGIHSTTIQPEFEEQSKNSEAGNVECLLSCAALKPTANCAESQCCQPPTTPDNLPKSK